VEEGKKEEGGKEEELRGDDGWCLEEGKGTGMERVEGESVERQDEGGRGRRGTAVMAVRK
jgi:hypothetical protein